MSKVKVDHKGEDLCEEREWEQQRAFITTPKLETTLGKRMSK